MNNLLIISMLLIASTVQAQDADWQTWVHQRAAEIKEKKATSNRYLCNSIKHDVDSALEDISKRWPCCVKPEMIDSAISLIDKYYNKECHWFDLENSKETFPHAPYYQAQEDLNFLKQYLGDCK